MHLRPETEPLSASGFLFCFLAGGFSTLENHSVSRTGFVKMKGDTLEEPKDDDDVEDESAELNGGEARVHGRPFGLDRLLLALLGTRIGKHGARMFCGGLLTGSTRFPEFVPIFDVKLPAGHNKERPDVESSTN